jgi:hypothetical protein
MDNVEEPTKDQLYTFWPLSHFHRYQTMADIGSIISNQKGKVAFFTNIRTTNGNPSVSIYTYGNGARGWNAEHVFVLESGMDTHMSCFKQVVAPVAFGSRTKLHRLVKY